MQLATKYTVYMGAEERMLLVPGGAFPLIFLTEVSSDTPSPERPHRRATATRTGGGPGGRGRGAGSRGLEPPGAHTPAARSVASGAGGPKASVRTPPPRTRRGF